MAGRDRAGLTDRSGPRAVAGIGASGSGVEAPFGAAEGRKFGLSVGIAFLVLGGVLAWRGHASVAYGAWVVGGLLVLAGLALPGRLGPVHRAWMGLAARISRVTTPVFLGLVYFLVFTPAGWLRRTLSRNPLHHEPTPDGYWKDRKGAGRSDMDRQF